MGNVTGGIVMEITEQRRSMSKFFRYQSIVFVGYFVGRSVLIVEQHTSLTFFVKAVIAVVVISVLALIHTLVDKW